MTTILDSGRCRRVSGLGAAVSCSFAAILALIAGPALAQRTPTPAGDAKGPRTVAFTATRGTWISLDVSPDGRTIVFELLGDLYLLPISGGTARPILRGAPFQSQPRFSPDGRSIGYVSDEDGSDNLWIANADGSDPRRLSAFPRSLVMSPAWAPDGRTLYATVVETRDEAAIWRFEVATGGTAKLVANHNGAGSFLVSTPAPGAYGPSPAPDGRSLWYASVTPSVARSYLRGRSQVVRFDLGSGQEHPVTLDITLAMKPLFSPDGRLLLYGARSRGQTGLRIRDLATGVERWLGYPTLRDELEARASRDLLPNAAFTPDGRAVIAGFGGQIHRLGIEDGSDTIIPFSAPVAIPTVEPLRSPHRIGLFEVIGRYPQHLALGPDGRAAFSVFARIYWLPHGDSIPRRLTATEHPREFMPAWSPDGRWIAFVTWGSEGGHLWKAPVGGGPPVRLSNGPGLWVDPVWLPGGDSLVVIRATTSAGHAAGGVPADAELGVVPASGGSFRSVGMATGARRLHLGADPRSIFATVGGSLVAIGLDDGSRRQVAALPPPPRMFSSGPSELRISPRGAEVAALWDERLFVMPLATGGAGPAAITPGTAVGGDGPSAFAWRPDGSGIAWLDGGRLRSWSKGGDATERVVRVALPRARPTGTVVLRGATVITMRGGAIVRGADLVVTGDRIAALGPRGAVAVPAGATIMDVTGRFIVPGLVDVHAHTGPRHELTEAESPISYATLAFGTTTVRDPQTGPDIFPLADLIDIGEVPGPRIFSTGPGIFGDRDLSSLEATRALLGRYRDAYGTHLIKSYLVGNRRQRQWVVEASRELGLMPTTEGAADTKMDLTHAIDGFSGNEHSVPTTPVFDDVVQLFARSGIAYTPTLLVTFGGALPIYLVQPREKAYRNEKLRRFIPDEDLYPRSAGTMLRHADEDYNYREAGAGAAAILRAGGHVALGGHGEMPGLQAHWEMSLLAEGGMTPLEVLRVATIEGARALGLDGDIGSLEPGKLADLLVLDRDPSRDLRAMATIRFVVKNGEVYDGNTLDRIRPTRRPLPTPWWRRGAVR